MTGKDDPAELLADGAGQRLASPARQGIKLPAPRDTLVDCVWLPRIIAKARFLRAGKLPPEYADRFCHPTGVDAQFLAFFQITPELILTAATRSEQDVVAWFTWLSSVNPMRIAEWNQIAVNLGRPGYPLAERFPIAKTTTYKHIDTTGMETVFELIEADELEHGFQI